MAIDFAALEKQLSRLLDKNFIIDTKSRTSGGSICESYKIYSGSKTYFLKTSSATKYDMFVGEHRNLNAITATNTFQVPQPIIHNKIDSYSYLLLEHINLKTTGPHAKLAECLAKLHRNTYDQFGWHYNNWIGTTPQRNYFEKNWQTFWRKNRLEYQLNLAVNKGAPHALIQCCESVLSNIDSLFEFYTPTPSLLHGDLWCGNFAFTFSGKPIVFDPACYYGDRETDIAMTELFGGFNQDFYAVYNEHYLLDSGYKIRRDFYNLYHILNHYNLFSGGYAAQAKHLCLKVLSEIK